MIDDESTVSIVDADRRPIVDSAKRRSGQFNTSPTVLIAKPPADSILRRFDDDESSTFHEFSIFLSAVSRFQPSRKFELCAQRGKRDL